MDDVVQGLSRQQKTLSPKYLYDNRGSQLFAQICETPEYYLTRTEKKILPRFCSAVGQDAPLGCGVLELGVGASDKAGVLLKSLQRPAWYSALDINESALQEALAGIQKMDPNLPTHGVCADFTQSGWEIPEPLKSEASQIIGFFPGSTIGNFDPAEAKSLMRAFHQATDGEGWLLVGADLVKDPATLIAAYDDAAGVTAAFNLNLLQRIRNELGAELEIDSFQHKAIYNAELLRMEMHIVSTVAQEIAIGEHAFRFEKGESLHTENSWKFTEESFGALAQSAGFSQVDFFTDENTAFGLFWLRS